MQIGRFKKKKKIFKIIQVIPTLISLANFLRSCSELKFRILNLDAKIVTVRSIDVIAMNINVLQLSVTSITIYDRIFKKKTHIDRSFVSKTRLKINNGKIQTKYKTY